jgi:hypothetical protein
MNYWFPEDTWITIKEYAGIYNVPNLHYHNLRGMVPLTYLLHNFKKFNDPNYTSELHDVNIFGNRLLGPLEYSWILQKRVQEIEVYKIIAKGYKSKQFYEALRLYINGVPGEEVLEIFYEHPSAFVYRRVHQYPNGLRVLNPQPCCRGFVLKPWTVNTYTKHELKHYITGEIIAVNLEMLSDWDKLLLKSKHFGNLKLVE